MNIPENLPRKYIGNVKFCTKEEALEKASVVAHDSSQESLLRKIFNRKDITPKEIMDFSIKVESMVVWELAFDLEKFQEYLLLMLTLDDTIRLLSRKPKKVCFFEEVFKMRSDLRGYISELPPEELIVLGKKIESSDFWGRILKRKDIIEYLEI